VGWVAGVGAGCAPDGGAAVLVAASGAEVVGWQRWVIAERAGFLVIGCMSTGGGPEIDRVPGAADDAALGNRWHGS